MTKQQFERIRGVWLNTDQPAPFAHAAAQTGVRFSNATVPTRISVSALRGRDFISIWLECSPVEATILRDVPERQARTVFVFVNSGQVRLDVGHMSRTLQKGHVAALRPGVEPISFTALGDQSDVLVFSIKSMLGLTMRRADEAAIQVLPEPSLNAFAFGACFGLAQAVPPRTRQAERELDDAAGAVARSLLKQWVVSREGQADLYRAAVRFIRVHAIDQALTPRQVATEFGVSERKLQALFQQADETIVRVIRRSRAEFASILLDDDPGHDAAVVAARSGFTSAKLMRAALHEHAGGEVDVRRAVA
ncbi:helix-turn-helix transcriptional regulator [Pseudoclavibacter sp. RFBA6]|uniref:AraC family transcriptional regulator n=1 Tax=Pseudoclavibacter sp. RFBA6 TaxID=2080573 RepID=UPI000CE7383B|nr:helix-turn-helix transcriptional regulator [Pseudoclavibacter sp. RFBA6]PPG42697.1 hypothetical protein C5C17_02495 [Pseudoclavibacter sp. RFBA6]